MKDKTLQYKSILILGTFLALTGKTVLWQIEKTNADNLVRRADELFQKENHRIPAPKELIPYIERLDDVTAETKTAGRINVTKSLAKIPRSVFSTEPEL